MPQVKEPLLKTLINEVLQEAAELTVGEENTKFDIKVGVSNPQSETKLGIRIQLKPKSEDFLFADPDRKGALSVAIMKKLNTSLGDFNIQVSKDTDAETQDPTVLGFFIPLSQIKNMIVTSLGGESKSEPTSPEPPKPPSTPPSPPPSPEDEDLDEDMDKWKTGINLKRSGYSSEKESGGITTEELFEKVNTLNDLINDVFNKISESEYQFKEYYERNEEHIDRTTAIISIIKDELEDRVEQKEPVGPDKGIEEKYTNIIKKLIKNHIKDVKKPINEVMRQKVLNEISGMVLKEDFYGFINAGNNILRSLEERFDVRESKRYLEYLVKNNIM